MAGDSFCLRQSCPCPRCSGRLGAGIETVMRKKKDKIKAAASVASGALPAEALEQSFPSIRLPIHPPYPPAEAKSVAEIPSGEGWLYEPKWDGFRCLAFRSGKTVALQSKAGQPLGRYFPELVEALASLGADKFVLDGEIVVEDDGQLSFDDLLLRIHPAESRIRRLARETPCTFLVFDLLVADGKSLLKLPLSQRKRELRRWLTTAGKNKRLRASPFSEDIHQAARWMKNL